MKRGVFLAGLLVAALFGTTACGFESTSNVLAPTSGLGATAPSFVGLWTSQDLSDAPGPNSCGSFSWTITSQTPTSLAGTFTAGCLGGSVSISGTASGELVGNTIPMTASGTATMAGFPPCPFSLTGTGYIENENTLRIDYSGTTCLGPVQGSETLHKPAPAAPPPPPPPPPPAPDPPSSPAPSAWHVPDGPLTIDRAQQVVNNTAAEFSNLTGVHSDGGVKIAWTEQLLRRTIWHLQVAGYSAGRQQNPSGAISNDKLTIFIDGYWHAYDIYMNFDVPGVPTTVIWWEVFPANHVPDGGIPD